MFSRVNWTLNTPVDPQTYEFSPNWRSRSTMTAREPWWQLGPSLWLLWKWWKWVPSSRQATEWPWCRIQKTQFLNKFKAEISGKILSFLNKIHFFYLQICFPAKQFLPEPGGPHNVSIRIRSTFIVSLQRSSKRSEMHGWICNQGK